MKTMQVLNSVVITQSIIQRLHCIHIFAKGRRIFSGDSTFSDEKCSHFIGRCRLFGKHVWWQIFRCQTTNKVLLDLLIVKYILRNMTNFSLQISSPNGCFEIVAIGGVALSITLLSASSRIPWVLRVPSILYIGSNMLLTVYKQINERKRKKYRKIIEKFQFALTLLHELCSTLTKSVQFVQEMELIDRGFTL